MLRGNEMYAPRWARLESIETPSTQRARRHMSSAGLRRGCTSGQAMKRGDSPLDQPQPRDTRSRVTGAFKLAVAGLLLAYVLAGLPWKDTVVYSGDGETRELSGRLIGDWKADRVHFRLDEEVDPSALPGPWRTAAMASDPIPLVREHGVGWRPSISAILREVEPAGLVLAVVLLVSAVLVQTTRWWRLLAVVGCPTPWVTALRFNFYGLFFNLVALGQAGGDVVKAVLVLREHPGRRVEAASSVLVDRLVGLLVLAVLGTAFIVFEGDRLQAMRDPALLLLGGAIVGVCLYASPWARRLTRFEYWISRMPMSYGIVRFDGAMLAYVRRPRELVWAATISALNHLFVALAILSLGRAFGDVALGPVEYAAVSFIGNTASALPISPGGWGVGEAVYQFLFEKVGGDGAIGVAVSVAYKLALVLIGMLGGVLILVSGGRSQLEDLRRMGRQLR